MKKFSILAASLLMLAACSNLESEESSVPLENFSETEIQEAKASFAEILSKAAYAEPSLRTFIKSKASEQYDLDNDVFYPFVKDEIVDGENKSFRDILLSYANDPLKLADIERKLPLLTIMVPDWSSLGCFSLKTWDTSDKRIAVGYENHEENNPIYVEGTVAGYLKDGDFPDFPILIVKDSDRMKVSGAGTKSGVSYEFIDDAFNPMKTPQTKVEHIYMKPAIDGAQDVSNFVLEENVPDILKETYSALGNDQYAVQRDYAFYGITPTKPEGRENYYIKEYIQKLHFDDYSPYLEDDESDFTPSNPVWDYKKNYGEKTAQELRDYFYYDGNIELKITLVIPSKKGDPMSTYKVVNARFSDLFAIDTVDLDYRHRTMFCRDWYVYTMKPEDIVPKWMDVNLDLPRWDLANYASTMTIVVEEMDPSATIEKEIDIVRKESDVTKITVGSDSTLVHIDHSKETSGERTEKYKITTTQGNDELGIATLYYMEPVVLDKATIEDEEGVTYTGYHIKTVSTGTVTFMIMPKRG